MRGGDGRSSYLHRSRTWNTPAYAGKIARHLVAGTGVQGTPPRMRGKPLNEGAASRIEGNTPAYAGKTCGRSRAPRPLTGTPPRMRGKRVQGRAADGQIRNTPAYAGKTRRGSWCGSFLREHPRVCGENRHLPLRIVWRRGTPPRMRGKPPGQPRQYRHVGNTPAYAGKTKGTRLFRSLASGNTPAYAGKTLHDQRVYRAKPSFSITSSDKPNTTTRALGKSNQGISS